VQGKTSQIDGFQVAKTRVAPAGGEDVLVKDVILAEAVTQGDERAIGHLLDRYEDTVKACARRACGRFADDAWGDVMASVFRAPGQSGALSTYQGQAPLVGYLKRAVINRAKRYAQRKANQERQLDPHRAGGRNEVLDPGQELVREEAEGIGRTCRKLLSDVIRRAIHRLSDDNQWLLYCLYARKAMRPGNCKERKGMTLGQLGAQLGVPKGTISRRRKRVIQDLQEYMAGIDTEGPEEGLSVEECREHVFENRNWPELASVLVGVLEELQGGGNQE